jgi:hypothetical protein
MSLTKIQSGMIENGAVGVDTLAANPDYANSQTLLSGTFNWIYQDSYYFDMGQITLPVGNMVALLLQVTPIDFDQPTLAWDGGSII